MRISHVLAFAAAATLSSAAFADSSGSTAPASRSATTVLVSAAPHSQYKLTPAEAQGMIGSFQLEDGRLLVLTSKRSTLYADFDGKREELVPVGQNRFVSRDSGAQLTFDQVPFGVQVVLNQAKQ
jgi:exo-beta-1,3-glucanase (GH17 family)